MSGNAKRGRIVSKNAKVLIVEDSTSLGEAYKAMLLGDDHQVELVTRVERHWPGLKSSCRPCCSSM